MITIHNFARGARGLRPMWLCEEMGLDYRVENHTYPTSAAYRAKNPLGSVPFLEDEGGVGINESLAMLLYVAERYGPTPLLPGRDQPSVLAQTMRMTVFAETELGLNTLLAARFGAPEEHKRNWTVLGAESRIAEAVAFTAAQLADGRPWLAGDAFTIADIAVSTSLGMWRGALGNTLAPVLAAYQDRAQGREAYQRAGVAAGAG